MWLYRFNPFEKKNIANVLPAFILNIYVIFKIGMMELKLHFKSMSGKTSQ